MCVAAAFGSPVSEMGGNDLSEAIFIWALLMSAALPSVLVCIAADTCIIIMMSDARVRRFAVLVSGSETCSGFAMERSCSRSVLGADT